MSILLIKTFLPGVETGLSHLKELKMFNRQLLYLQIFKFQVKDTVRDFLPPDQPATRKNPLYRNLFDGFDKIDGKPTEAERRVCFLYLFIA